MDQRVLFVISADVERRRALAGVLERGLGLAAIGMGRPDSAAVLAHRPPPAAVLVDLTMPDRAGYTLAERLSADPETRSVPIVGLGGRDVADHDAARAVGCTAFVGAGADPADLVWVVRTCLSEAPPRVPGSAAA